MRVVTSGQLLLRDATRPLLLPVEPALEASAVSAISSILSEAGIEPSDHAEWLSSEDSYWRDTGSPSALLAEVVSAAISTGIDDGDVASYLAASHFASHEKLMGFAGSDHDTSRSVLSHARLIAHLAATEKMSATQIARVLNARDSRIGVGWREVTVVLAALHLTPSVSKDDVLYLFGEDELAEQRLLADADDETVLEIVEAEARRLGFGEGLGELLAALFPSDEAPFTPYLQILHFQCSIAEFFDHAVSGAYEFKPRGAAAAELFEKYPDAMVDAANPFLNNAKSVERLDLNWARSKKSKETPGAFALAEILERLEVMGFAARKDLASLLRRVIARQIRILSESAVELPDSLTTENIKALLSSISNSDTNTAGVLEQRAVDFASRLLHPPPEWVDRGLSDPVNATNLSGKKLGDCDFLNAKSREVVAYEAHGGRLSEVYLTGHVRTLEKTVPRRLAEWQENFGEGASWSLVVIFVAHSIADDVVAVRKLAIGGVDVEIRVTTFDDFFIETGDHAEAIELADALVLAPLRERRTPSYVRQALLDRLGSV